VMEQETRKEVYLGLKGAGLPIPADLRTDFEPKVMQVPMGASMMARVPMMGADPVITTPTLAPTAGDFAVPTDGGTVQPGVPATPVQPVQQDGGGGFGDDEGDRPEESDEMRKDMPKAASQNPVALYRASSRMRTITEEHYNPPGEMEMRKTSVRVGEGDEAHIEEREMPVDDGKIRGAWADPKHVGMRRYAGVTSNTNRDTLKQEPVAVEPS
jgi:hypothetical protein